MLEGRWRTIAERMYGVGAKFRAADNSRVNGWDQVRSRLRGEDDRPMIYVFESCNDSIRTIPALQHDDAKIEDINTDMEDHAADEWRYACMSRPYVPPVPKSEAPKQGYSLEDLWKSNEKRR